MTGSPETPEPAGQVSDATPGNWVDDKAPDWAKPYLRLSRADRAIGTWLLFIPCLWGVLLAAAATGWRWFDLWIIIGCGLGAWLMRGAGCTWNDYTDREIDAQVTRTKSRPLPMGHVTPKQALYWLAAQCAVAFLILLTFNKVAILLGVLSLVPVAIYPFAKRFTNWPQVFLGLAFNWGALLAWTAHTGSVGLPAIALYAAGVLWTLFYDTIYAHQDTEDDAVIGVKSSALQLGENTAPVLRLFMMLTVVLLAGAVLAALVSVGNLLAMVVALAGAWAFGWHMTWILARLDIENPENCRQLFLASKTTGFIFVLFLAAASML